MSTSFDQMTISGDAVTIASIDSDVDAIIDDVASTMNTMSFPTNNIATTSSGTVTTTTPTGRLPSPVLSMKDVVDALLFEYNRARSALENQLAALASDAPDDQALISAIQQALAFPPAIRSISAQLSSSITPDPSGDKSIPRIRISKRARDDDEADVTIAAAPVSDGVSSSTRPRKIRKLAAVPMTERPAVEPTRASSRIMGRKLSGPGAPRKGALVDYFDYAELPSAAPKRRARKARASQSTSQTASPSPKSARKSAVARRLPRTQVSASEVQTESPPAEKSSPRSARRATRSARLGNDLLG